VLDAGRDARRSSLSRPRNHGHLDKLDDRLPTAEPRIEPFDKLEMRSAHRFFGHCASIAASRRSSLPLSSPS